MILVTGGTGLVGSHLLFDLAKTGSNIRAIKRAESSLETTRKVFKLYASGGDDLFKRIEWVNGDVLDVYSLTEAMQGVEQVYHCAACVSLNPSGYKQLNKINIDGTANVMNMALDAGVKKVCHVSSVAALGEEDPKKGAITEKVVWKTSPANSAYAISKYGAEREAWRIAEEGLDVIIVNPSVIIGPGDWAKGSASMITAAYKGLRFYTEGITGFVDVRDVARAMIQLMDSTVKNERFIVSSENVSFRDFFYMVHDNLGKPRPAIKAGRTLTGLGWRLNWIKSLLTGSEPKFTRDAARAAHAKRYYSNAKIRNAIDLTFIPVEQSVKNTCAAFLRDVS